MILHSRYCEANTNVLTLLKGEWPKMVYCPKGTTVEWKNIFSSGKNQLRLHIVPLKEMWGGKNPYPANCKRNLQRRVA